MSRHSPIDKPRVLLGLKRSIATLFLAILPFVAAQAATAKGTEPLRVVTPSGKHAWLRGAAATAWWHDYYAAGTANTRGCPCTSPTAAARYAQSISKRWKRWPQAWLLVPQHGATMLYYPATGTTPSYVLTPDALGTANARWDDWEVASSRMVAIIDHAIAQS